MVDVGELREHARAAFKALVHFAILKSTDPEKQRAIDELQVLRCQVQEKLDVIVPGWEEDL